jgi:NAD+ kinase
VKRIGFVLKRGEPRAREIARDLVPWLVGQGIDVAVPGDLEGLPAAVAVVPESSFGRGLDLLVVLGGDGTLLHGAALVADEGVPVLGINLGRLGFLTPFAPADARATIAAGLAGSLAVEERLRLRVRVIRASGDVVAVHDALNDAVIAQSAMARLIQVVAALDGRRITSYRADGLIVATPTGSTAYNLAAGGPILSPGQTSLAITPICPHTLTNRPLVIPSMGRLDISLNGGSRSVVLTIDGQVAYPLRPGDRVEITQSPHPARLCASLKSYFEILREKLCWGDREI